MRRAFGMVCVGLLSVFLVTTPALAGRSWCRSDPIVSIDGTEVQVWVAIPDEYTPYVTKATELKFSVPKSIKNRQLLFTDDGFNGHGEKVSWNDLKDGVVTETAIPLALEVKLHIDQKKLDQAFGKDTVVPVQVIVNVGTTIKTLEVAGIKNTKFDLLISTEVDPDVTTPGN